MTNPYYEDLSDPSVQAAYSTRRGASAVTSRVDRFIILPLLLVYLFLVQLGNVSRFSDEEGAFGVSTIIFLVLVAVGLARALRAFIEEPVFWVLLALVAFMSISSLSSPSLRGSYLALGQFLLYVMLAGIVSRTPVSPQRLTVIWAVIALGLLVSAGLTIIDFMGIANVPYNNDVRIQTKVGSFWVEQATGFFSRRSGMASIFSIGITGSLVYALGHRSLMVRSFFLAAGLVGLLCLFLAHNRSGVLGAIGVIGLYTLLSPRFRGFRRIGILMLTGILVLSTSALILAVFPEQVEIYAVKLGFVGAGERQVWASDYERIDLFFAAVRRIAVNPFGAGFGLVKLPDGTERSAHNVITTIIWATGLFALIWIPAFAATLFVRFRGGARIQRDVVGIGYDALTCAMFASLLNGMTHNSIHTGVAWIVFGLMMSMRNYSARAPEPEPVSAPVQPEWRYSIRAIE